MFQPCLQTAGHNALLLFVHLTLQIMEEQIMAAFRELRAKQAAVSEPAAGCQAGCVSHSVRVAHGKLG